MFKGHYNEWYPGGLQISLHIRSPGFSVGGGILGPSDLDLGNKVGSLDFGRGYSGTLGFGLRKESWKFGFGRGGILGPSDLDLGKKVGSLDFLGGGVFWDTWIWTIFIGGSILYQVTTE